jgi:hypothetical protein
MTLACRDSDKSGNRGGRRSVGSAALSSVSLSHMGKADAMTINADKGAIHFRKAEAASACRSQGRGTGAHPRGQGVVPGRFPSSAVRAPFGTLFRQRGHHERAKVSTQPFASADGHREHKARTQPFASAHGHREHKARTQPFASAATIGEPTSTRSFSLAGAGLIRSRFLRSGPPPPTSGGTPPPTSGGTGGRPPEENSAGEGT